MTVYELIQQLSGLPADMPICTSVVGERVEPIDAPYEDGTVDIDIQKKYGIINAIQTRYGDSEFCKLEVEI